MERIKIKGLGYAKAQRKVSNHDLSKIVDTSDEWIVQRTGIHSRYVTVDENTSDIAGKAARNALEDAQINPEDIDVIICCTATPDNVTPSCASLVQGKLDLKNVRLALDVNAACSGFIYGLELAHHLLDSYSNILVIGAETLSKLMDWSDRNTCVLFGDGAGAAIVSKGNHDFFFTSTSQPDLKGVLQAQSRKLSSPLEKHIPEAGFLTMNGKEVFRFAVGAMQNSIDMILEKANKTMEDIDLIIPHQANLRIIQHVAKRENLPLSKFYINLDRFGNTSAASIAIALACAKEEGRLKPGMKIICVGFGGGLTSGAIYMEY